MSTPVSLVAVQTAIVVDANSSALDAFGKLLESKGLLFMLFYFLNLIYVFSVGSPCGE